MFGAPNSGILSWVCRVRRKWFALFEGFTGLVWIQNRLAQHALWPLGLHRRAMGGLTKNNLQLLR
jgi:hypothetical protein